MNPPEREIRELHARWIAAVNAGELERLLSWMTDDVVLISPGQAPQGREGFAANYRAALERIRFHCTSDLEEVLVAGDLAYTRCRDTLAITPLGGGDTTTFSGHRCTVYRRQPDGRWLLARDIHTLVPAAKGG